MSTTKPRKTYTRADFAKWGGIGGRNGTRADKIRAARVRWDKEKRIGQENRK